MKHDKRRQDELASYLVDEDRETLLRMRYVREALARATRKPDGSLRWPHHPFAEAARALASIGVPVRDTTLRKQWERIRSRLGDDQLDQVLDELDDLGVNLDAVREIVHARRESRLDDSRKLVAELAPKHRRTKKSN